VYLIATQTIAASEARDRRNYLILEAFSALEFGLLATDLHQELLHHGTQRGVLLCGSNPRSTIDLIRQ
jgi:hypothetical protein